jgi:protein SCO1/2
MRRACLGLLLLTACNTACFASLAQRQLQDARLNPVPGTLLPLGTVFMSAESGEPVTLGEALGGKPAVLLLVDYTCRFICGSTLAVAAAAMPDPGPAPNADFRLAVIGIDPRDGPGAARAMKSEKLAAYPILGEFAAFLTGGAESVEKVTDALGYSAVYDREIDQFAHPAGAVVLTPDGRVSRVISGLGLNGETVREALADARQGRVAERRSGIWLLCYGFDALRVPYSSAIRVVLTIAGILTAIGVAAFAGLLFRHAKRTRLT